VAAELRNNIRKTIGKGTLIRIKESQGTQVKSWAILSSRALIFPDFVSIMLRQPTCDN
jgi:hypothetical protein